MNAYLMPLTGGVLLGLYAMWLLSHWAVSPASVALPGGPLQGRKEFSARYFCWVC